MPTFRQRFVASVTRRYPFLSGCGTLANHPLLRKIAGPGTQNQQVWAAVPGGEVLVSLEDHVGRAAFYLGDLDRKITLLCQRIVRPGDTVIDIGANVGLVTLWLSSLVGPAGRVHSFEPNPEAHNLLQQAIERNGLKNVGLHQMALGAQETELELRVPGRNLGMGTLVSAKELGVDDIRSYRVPVRRLSDIAAQEKISSVRLIKIDVEGFELEVLRGARQMLETVRPDALLIELIDAEPAVGPGSVLQLLQDCGYTLFGVPRSWVRLRLSRVDPSAGFDGGFHEVLACGNDALCKQLSALAGM